MKVSIVSAFLLCLAATLAPADDRLGLRVPPGFAVIEVADSALANDIYRMTLDPRGRVVVAGRGYIRTLIDDDGDGRADRSVEFADGPRDGAMGLLWEGDTLYVTGDGGLRRYRDRDGDGRADGPSELIRAMKTGGEHTAHAIRRGPDGWLYVICGNFTGIDASYAPLATSPIKEPIAGCVLRFTPDLERVGDRGRRVPQRVWHGLQPRRRAVRVRLGQRALRVAPLVRADTLLSCGRGRPSRLACAAAGGILAGPARMIPTSPGRSSRSAGARPPAWLAIAMSSSPRGTAVGSSCSTGPSARSTS